LAWCVGLFLPVLCSFFFPRPLATSSVLDFRVIFLGSSPKFSLCSPPPFFFSPFDSPYHFFLLLKFEGSWAFRAAVIGFLADGRFPFDSARLVANSLPPTFFASKIWAIKSKSNPGFGFQNTPREIRAFLLADRTKLSFDRLFFPCFLVTPASPH